MPPASHASGALRLDCPQCGSGRCRPVLTGLPDPRLVEAEAAGLVVLGGDRPQPPFPNRACLDCGHRWRTVRPQRRDHRRLQRWLDGRSDAAGS